MATTHVFIVGTNTFKYHLEYLFVGTGSRDNVIDFNNVSSSSIHFQQENALVGLMADFSRVRVGDNVIFYLQQDGGTGISEGKFYGVFKITSLAFLDNNDNSQFLKQQLGKSLTFRARIGPYQVYQQGVTEWEALDEIGNIASPCQMLWSLIYRKLKGNRGNTMITLYESERLINLIRTKNNRNTLSGQHFTFDTSSQSIVKDNSGQNFNYIGRQEDFNLLPRLVEKHRRNQQFETHLQQNILQNIQNIPVFQNENIEWIGNEVSCGVGMQRIDIMLGSVDNQNNHKIIPIELKSIHAHIGITKQLQRYVDWLEQYYLPNKPSDISPMIISRKIDNKQTNKYINLIHSFNDFNSRNNSHLRLRYVEFEITSSGITFTEIPY